MFSEAGAGNLRRRSSGGVADIVDMGKHWTANIAVEWML